LAHQFFAEENPTDGAFTANADTSVAGTFGYRVHYIAQGTKYNGDEIKRGTPRRFSWM
jgi:hypothetical protein